MKQYIKSRNTRLNTNAVVRDLVLNISRDNSDGLHGADVVLQEM